ncbi:NAD(P)/FAD-dependent oxidoreductase [Breoghania sp.]|uniref:FAD/NAD(P)-dependent oxidoreductase n=1 Tax=Breoghania sp. TaxID=2065378 RepID=UPI002AAC0AAA|nr:NAD(P)/FAD-dependent oxidoreductase [Breoghania sp.]
MSVKTVDLLVIGAGPAGIAAATEAANAGLSVTVMDEQPRPGGQIYRAVETTSAKMDKILGKDFVEGRPLVESLRASNAELMPETLVWNIGSDLSIDYSTAGVAHRMKARRIVAATGALERPMPIPGWTLPGVTTAGALQILMKTSSVVKEDCVLMGAGPLIWLVAVQMIDAGCPPKAIVENLPKGRTLAALPHLPKALRASEYLFKGLKLIRRVKQAGVPIHTNASALAIEGEGSVKAVTFKSGGQSQRIEATSVALHQGVVPNQQITRLIRADHRWDASQKCFIPVLDETCQTTVQGIYIAGDGASINGAKCAALQGRMVALNIAASLGRSVDTGRIQSLKAAIARETSVRPMLETLYAPAPEILDPADGTVVCRCEEVTAGAIRATVDLGAPGPNQVKSMLRSGMGPCQGRTCGLAVAQIIAARKGETPDVTGYYRIRPPLKPIPLMELASYDPARDEEPAEGGIAAQ